MIVIWKCPFDCQGHRILWFCDCCIKAISVRKLHATHLTFPIRGPFASLQVYKQKIYRVKDIWLKEDSILKMYLWRGCFPVKKAIWNFLVEKFLWGLFKRLHFYLQKWTSMLKKLWQVLQKSRKNLPPQIVNCVPAFQIWIAFLKSYNACKVKLQ